MAIGIVLSVFGLGFFCWLLFTLAVYALPFLAGLSAGLAAFHSGAGLIGALVVGFLVGVTILVLGQIVLGHCPHTVDPPLHRADLCRTRGRRRLSAMLRACRHRHACRRMATRLRRRWRHRRWRDCLCAHGARYPAVGRAGLRGGYGSVSRRLAAARPDQGVALAIRIIEQVGEDRGHEARVVELERGSRGPASTASTRQARYRHDRRRLDGWGNVIGLVGVTGCPPFPTLRPLSLRLACQLSCAGPFTSATSSPRMLFGARPRPLFG